MVSTLKALIAFLIIFTTTLIATPQASRAEGVSAYAAVGPLLGFPSSLRIGYDFWEAGKLNDHSLGVMRRLQTGWSFLSFGFAAVTIGDLSFGPAASAGFLWKVMPLAHVRGELFAVGSVSGAVTGSGLLGLMVIF